MRELIIDRFENGFAVCEDESRKIVDIKIERLPKGSKEGDVIITPENGNIYIDKNKTDILRQKNIDLENKLMRK